MRPRMVLGRWLQPLLRALFLAGAVLAGAVWPAGAALSAGDDVKDRVYVLVEIEYLKSGKAFGIKDFGYRFPPTFCETQKDVLLDRWRAAGAKPWRGDALWRPERGTASRLACIALETYQDAAARRALLRQRLPKK
ncbi:MAG: hypothetical protein GC191_17475 [Azospirillum sp.]|nr:hypothetical protein [Azospirillum sp.]